MGSSHSSDRHIETIRGSAGDRIKLQIVFLEDGNVNIDKKLHKKLSEVFSSNVMLEHIESRLNLPDAGNRLRYPYQMKFNMKSASVNISMPRVLVTLKEN